MTDLTPERVAELRALAGAADASGWTEAADPAEAAGAWPTNGMWTYGYLINAYGADRATARYVAAVSPDVMTALLDEIERLRAEIAERDSFDPEEDLTLAIGRAADALPRRVITASRVPDLMEALEQSIAAAREARTRHPQPAGRYRVRAPGGDLEGTVDPDAGHGPHDGDVFVEWDDGESGWYAEDTVERI